MITTQHETFTRHQTIIVACLTDGLVLPRPFAKGAQTLSNNGQWRIRIEFYEFGEITHKNNLLAPVNTTVEIGRR